jgi:hypothetical protein
MYAFLKERLRCSVKTMLHSKRSPAFSKHFVTVRINDLTLELNNTFLSMQEYIKRGLNDPLVRAKIHQGFSSSNRITSNQPSF